MPPASPLVLPQVQVTGTSQEARLTAAWSQGLGGRGHKGRVREKEKDGEAKGDRDRKETGQQTGEERDTETTREAER